jgi:ribosome-binding protein aMBF1 (putative translation factor)
LGKKSKENYKMLQNLIRMAENKAMTQQALSKRFNVDYRRLCDYKAGRRVPDDVLIGQLAEYVGYDPIETILACKLDTADEKKATLWEKWLINWRAQPESNWRPSASEADTLSN